MVRSILRGLRHDIRHGLKRARHRITAPRIDERRILDALSRLPAPAPRLVMVHSSLSACGYVEGGTSAVIRALRQWNAGGTLAMPTHTYCYPHAGAPTPVFDIGSTPSVVGAVTDAFWRQAGVRRSLHPTHSIAVEGPGADDLVAGHEACDTPCGSGTPYERLVLADAAVLMFGASLDAYTLFHTAEADAAVPYLYEPEPVPLAYLEPGGAIKTMTMWKHDMQVLRSFHEKDAWLERQGLLHRVTLGEGQLMFLPHARTVHQVTVSELRRQPSFLRAA